MSMRTRVYYAVASAILFMLSIAEHWTRPSVGLVGDPQSEAIAAALNLASTGRLSNPFHVLPTGPTAHVAPAFPFLAAGLISIFGTGVRGNFALDIFANLGVSLQIAALPFVAEVLGIGLPTGFLAALFYLAAKVPPFPKWEVSFAALLSLLVIALAVRFFRKWDTGPLVTLGLAWALLLLMAPSFLNLYCLFLLYAFYDRIRTGGRLTLAYLGLLLLPIALIAPWTVRNYITFGKVVPIRDNLGLELQVSNNDCTGFSLAENLKSGCFATFHPNVSLTQALRVKELGEVRYNDLKTREAIDWIEAHPRRFFEFAVLRFTHFWFPTEQSDVRRVLSDTSGRRWYALCVWLMTILSLPGLILLYFSSGRSLAMILGSCLAFYPIIYYFVQYDPRYRIPILWITFLLAAYATVSSCRFLMTRIRTSSLS